MTNTGGVARIIPPDYFSYTPVARGLPLPMEPCDEPIYTQSQVDTAVQKERDWWIKNSRRVQEGRLRHKGFRWLFMHPDQMGFRDYATLNDLITAEQAKEEG